MSGIYCKQVRKSCVVETNLIRRDLQLYDLTIAKFSVYNQVMKNLFLVFIMLAMLVMTGCGVKSDLVRTDKSFPRDYPVY